jgi:hypothetical protein
MAVPARPTIRLTPLELAPNLIPLTESFSQGDYDREVARTLYLLGEAAANSTNSSNVPLSKRIEELLGYAVTEYCDLVFACAMNPVVQETSNLVVFQVPALKPEHFATTTVPVTKAEDFMGTIGMTDEALAGNIKDSKTPDRNLTVLRIAPLLHHQDAFVPLDLGFLLDKAGRSLFWTAIKNNTDAKQRGDMISEWRTLVERSVSDCFITNLGTTGTFYPAPRFKDGAEAFDGIS